MPCVSQSNIAEYASATLWISNESLPLHNRIVRVSIASPCLRYNIYHV